jgi:hypothetical protein
MVVFYAVPMSVYTRARRPLDMYPLADDSRAPNRSGTCLERAIPNGMVETLNATARSEAAAPTPGIDGWRLMRRGLKAPGHLTRIAEASHGCFG